jgi:hypothetical protein
MAGHRDLAASRADAPRDMARSKGAALASVLRAPRAALYRSSDDAPYSYVVLPRRMVPYWLSKRKETGRRFGSQVAQQGGARIAPNIVKKALVRGVRG